MANLNTEDLLLEGVGLYYTKIKTPSKKFGTEDEYEFVVDAHVDKATAKTWNKEFPKQKAKELDYDEFVEKFGAENAIGDEEQFFIRLKKPATYKDKKDGQIKAVSDKFRPRVFIDAGDGELEDITFEKLVGNGSKGVIQYEVTKNDFGTFAKLFAIKVDELVEVEQSGTGKFNVLGKVKSLAENPNAVKDNDEGVKVETPQENNDTEMDDDIPF